MGDFPFIHTPIQQTLGTAVLRGALCSATLDESLHLSVLPLIIHKVKMNMIHHLLPRNPASEVSAQSPVHRKSSVVTAIWILLRSFHSLIGGRDS